MYGNHRYDSTMMALVAPKPGVKPKTSFMTPPSGSRIARQA